MKSKHLCFLILCHFLFQICEGGDVKIPWSNSWSDQLEEQTALYMTAMYSNTLNSIFIYKAFLTVYLSVFISFYPPSILVELFVLQNRMSQEILQM